MIPSHVRSRAARIQAELAQSAGKLEAFSDELEAVGALRAALTVQGGLSFLYEAHHSVGLAAEQAANPCPE